MAITGKTSTIPRVGRRKVGALVRRAAEFSAQTFPQGILLIRTAGSVKQGVTGTAQSTGLVGIAAASGQNISTTTVSGQAKCAYYAIEQGLAYKLTLPGVFTKSAHLGVTAGISMDTAGAVVLQTTAASCGTIQQEVEWDSGVAVQDGDSNVVVYFVFADSAIAV